MYPLVSQHLPAFEPRVDPLDKRVESELDAVGPRVLVEVVRHVVTCGKRRRFYRIRPARQV